ncbi:myotubularin-related protein 6 [Copidosoma floridanum]|uniref:myotubularin-related protein 6 n=1 Tax=Copidosoma floridanum TaxID=29053 RepID=UPI0006C97887|nr:myotubularin-related protein 6 [Copidosoma floridanum]
MNISDVMKIQKVENVLMLDKYGVKHTLGTFYLTETHFIFTKPNGKKKIWVLNSHVASAEKLPLLTSGSPLCIKCKHFFVVTFVIPKERDCHEVYLTLIKLSSPTRTEDLYCFDFKGNNEGLIQEMGWNFFSLQDEFQRQGVPNDEWSLSYLNVNYELCESYPKYLYVPSSCSNTVLMGSAKFRSKGRLPVLTYLHNSNKASICRCSQPLSGFNARCLKDEQMLYNLLCTNPDSKYLCVVDTRPRINAMANRAAGKGYENENFYDNIKFQFFGIENIHVMRSSLNKLLELQKSTSMSSFLSGLESSGWLKHIRAILETSWFIARNVVNGISVVVHCSDGWDRTAQVCSLAALMLDPFYRTIHGFQVLIEKDWLAFGHKFNDRCGYVTADSKELAPIFTQFIDATYQLSQQYPFMFQFNEQYLITLHDHVQSCQYGTFIGNCEKDRQFYKVSDRTYSLWGYISQHINEFINPLYSNKQSKEASNQILKPKLLPQNIVLWRGLYLRFENGVHPRESYEDLLSTINSHVNSIEDHIKFLTKKINAVEALTPNKTDKSSLSKQKLNNDYSKENTFKELITIFARDPNNKSKTEIQQLVAELNSVSLEWKSSKNRVECKCATTFDAFNKQYHCWSCGNVMCQRCIRINMLSGYSTERAVPICKFCSQKYVTVTQ